MNNKIKIIKFNKYKAINGTLIPFYLNKKFPMKVKRFFIIKGNKNQTRGRHAHKICRQIFIPINGSSTITILSPKKKIINLNSNSNIAIMLPKLHWCEITFKSNPTSVLVLCDYEYKKSEYINNIREFYSNFKNK
jgi:hypothetical protein